tara:strand:- start:270 stop:449 length:180 start_codon:yes stop_codon:yes gene_type:complete
MWNDAGPKTFGNRLFSWTSILIFLMVLMVCGVLMTGCTLHSSISDRGLTLSVLKNAEFE